ncbi:hypothetical protein OC846_006867, partial [Tilletia horrida]
MHRSKWFQVNAAPTPESATPSETANSNFGAPTSHPPQAVALEQLLSDKIAASSFDSSTLLPKDHTPAPINVTTSPWLRRVRWGVLLDGIPLSLACDLVCDPARLFALAPSRPHAQALRLAPVDMRADLIDKVHAFLIDADEDLSKHGSDDIRSKLHCDEVDYVHSKQARRPLAAGAQHVSASARLVAEVLGLAWTLFYLDAAGAFASEESELYPLRPLLESIQSFTNGLRDLDQRMQRDDYDQTHIGTALFRILSQPVRGPGSSSVALVFSALRGINR